MQISQLHTASARPRTAAVTAVKPEAKPHDPGLLRDIVEKGAGVIGAVSRLPSSIVAGLAVGGYQGGRRGADADFVVDPKSVALGVITCNALQGLAQGAATGLILFGPSGAATAALKEAGQSAVGLYMFVKGGAAEVVGKEMASAIDGAVKPGEGGFQGVAAGAWAGTVSGTKVGTKTGYQEGRATASGVLEGLKEVPREFAQAEGPQGPLWKRVLSVAAGVVTAAFAAPVGLALSLMKGQDGQKAAHPAARYGTTAATGALMGGLAGSALGPVGIMVGAGIGAVAGMLSPASKPTFDNELSTSIARSTSDDGDLGSELANHRRDLVQKVVTGTLSGARQGWDSGVTFPAQPASS